MRYFILFCRLPTQRMSKREQTLFLVLVAWVTFVILLFVIKDYVLLSGKIFYSSIAKIASTGLADDDHNCKYLSVSAFNLATMRFVKAIPHPECAGLRPSLVFLEGNHLKVNSSIDSPYILCHYSSLYRCPKNDFRIIVNYTSEVFNDSIELRPTDENIAVECSYDPNELPSMSYFNLIRENDNQAKGKREKLTGHKKLYSPSEAVSVILLGVDSMSRQNFERAMPQTRNFILHALRAYEFKKHSVIGYGTYPNVIAILTGLNDVEVVHKYRMYFPDIPYDNVSFIWKNYEEAGYRTHMILDSVEITSFHWRKAGFHRKPTDFTNRPLIMKVYSGNQSEEQKVMCLGDRPSTAHHLDYLKDFASAFNSTDTPYFSYTFLASLTHDNMNMASSGDEMYLRFFRDLSEQALLHNTVVIFFSDHGIRWGAFRETFNGMVEERTPFLFLIMPPWFKEKYPAVAKNLNHNQERLTSPFDIYATMLDILYFQSTSANIPNVNASVSGISLFQKISAGRTCSDAGVQLHYCLCRNMKITNISSELVNFLSIKIMNRLESIIFPVRNSCVLLNLGQVMSSYVLHPASGDSGPVYRITIMAAENRGVYEGTVKTWYRMDALETEVVDVTRINMYRGQADCLTDAKLMPFCLCQDPGSNNNKPNSTLSKLHT